MVSFRWTSGPRGLADSAPSKFQKDPRGAPTFSPKHSDSLLCQEVPYKRYVELLHVWQGLKSRDVRTITQMELKLFGSLQTQKLTNPLHMTCRLVLLSQRRFWSQLHDGIRWHATAPATTAGIKMNSRSKHALCCAAFPRPNKEYTDEPPALPVSVSRVIAAIIQVLRSQRGGKGLGPAVIHY